MGGNEQTSGNYLPVGIGGSNANNAARNTMVDWTTPLFEEGVYRTTTPNETYYEGWLNDLLRRYAARANAEGFVPVSDNQAQGIQF